MSDTSVADPIILHDEVLNIMLAGRDTVSCDLTSACDVSDRLVLDRRHDDRDNIFLVPIPGGTQASACGNNGEGWADATAYL